MSGLPESRASSCAATVAGPPQRFLAGAARRHLANIGDNSQLASNSNFLQLAPGLKPNLEAAGPPSCPVNDYYKHKKTNDNLVV